MKRLLALALCALFACQAEARTLYVDAKRPNNKGNALSAKKAKKTLQAAINIAKKGDTIVVYPGTYAPIKTNNKKIAIKSARGQKKTKIVKGTNTGESIALAQLGKTTSFVDTAWGIYPSKSGFIGSYWTTSGGYYGVKKVTKSSYPLSAGQATRLTGFLLDGMKRDGERVVGVSGGTVASCTIQRLGAAILHRGTITTGYGDSYGTYPYSYTSYTDVRAAHGSKLLDCTVKSNLGPLGSDGGLLSQCTVSRTRITGNSTQEYYGKGALASDCTFDNSLLAGNTCKGTAIASSTFLNCTIANNTMSHSAAGIPLAEKSRFDNCILWNNYSKRKGTEWVEVEKNETETGYYDEYDDWCEGDRNTTTTMTNGSNTRSKPGRSPRPTTKNGKSTSPRSSTTSMRATSTRTRTRRTRTRNSSTPPRATTSSRRAPTASTRASSRRSRRSRPGRRTSRARSASAARRSTAAATNTDSRLRRTWRGAAVAAPRHVRIGRPARHAGREANVTVADNRAAW